MDTHRYYKALGAGVCAAAETTGMVFTSILNCPNGDYGSAGNGILCRMSCAQRGDFTFQAD